MDKIEEDVKKILEPPDLRRQVRDIVAIACIDKLKSRNPFWDAAEEILQLFEKEEPKPSEDRLLTREELEAVDNVCLKAGIGPTSISRLWKQLEAQRDLTASIKDAEIERWKKIVIKETQGGLLLKELTESRKEAECQERVERIFREVETHYQGNYAYLDKHWWQALKKQEGVNE